MISTRIQHFPLHWQSILTAWFKLRPHWSSDISTWSSAQALSFPLLGTRNDQHPAVPLAMVLAQDPASQHLVLVSNAVINSRFRNYAPARVQHAITALRSDP